MWPVRWGCRCSYVCKFNQPSPGWQLTCKNPSRNISCFVPMYSCNSHNNPVYFCVCFQNINLHVVTVSFQLLLVSLHCQYLKSRGTDRGHLQVYQWWIAWTINVQRDSSGQLNNDSVTVKYRKRQRTTVLLGVSSFGRLNPPVLWLVH